MCGEGDVDLLCLDVSGMLMEFWWVPVRYLFSQMSLCGFFARKPVEASNRILHIVFRRQTL